MLMPPKTLGHLCCWLLVAWIAVRLIALVGGQLPLIAMKDSIGYGDSYNLMSAQHLAETGEIYPLLTPTHPTPAVYSPLLYLSIAFANFLLPSESLYLGARIFELFCYLACVFMAGLITRQLIPVPSSFWIGTLMAASFASMTFWVYQLRSDYPAIAFNLMSIFILLRSGQRAARASRQLPSGMAALAGTCAGLAIQYRFTMGAAAAAGLLWLLLSRQWRASWVFTALATAVGAGGYLLVAIHEPHIADHLLAVTGYLPDASGAFALMRRSITEPITMLGLGVLLPLIPMMLRFRHKRLTLLAVYGGFSFALASLTGLNFGANINYFYEAMFAVTPFAVLGFYKLWKIQRRPSVTAPALFVLIAYLVASGDTLPRVLATAAKVSVLNQRHESLKAALKGARILSSIPDVAILTPDRHITEPGVLHQLTLTQGIDLAELNAMVLAGQFNVVVTQLADYSWRGVTVLHPKLKNAITGSYRPACRIDEMLFHLPAGAVGLMAEKLSQAGCHAETCGAGLACPGLGVRIDLFTE